MCIYVYTYVHTHVHKHMEVEQRPARQTGSPGEVDGNLEKQMDLDTVLVSCDCCNYYKLGDLKETYSPRILEVVSPKSGCRQGHVPSGVSGPFLCLPASGSGYPSLVYSITPASSSIFTQPCICVSPLLIWTPVIGFRTPYAMMTSS